MRKGVRADVAHLTVCARCRLERTNRYRRMVTRRGLSPGEQLLVDAALLRSGVLVIEEKAREMLMGPVPGPCPVL